MEKYLSLIVLVFLPLIAALLIASPIFGKNDEIYIRRFAKWFNLIHLLYASLFIANYNFSGIGMSYITELKIFNQSWVNNWGITATFGVDAFSLMLVILTSFIFLIALIISKKSINHNHKSYYSLVLLLETAVLGVFCAKDMFLFFLFWELELIPVFLLIRNWGSGNAQQSAMKFLLYTFLGSIFIFLGILALYYYSFSVNSILTSDMEIVSIQENIYPLKFQIAIFLCFLIGFAVKLPIVPLHTWLSDVHSDAPMPISIILGSILLKMGAYGIIRFNLIMFNSIFKILAPILMIFALINIIYSGLLAIVQKDIKRIIAYSSISHMGIFLIGLISLNEIGITGAIYQIFAHAFICTGLFIIAGIVYNKCNTRNIDEICGLGTKMPNFMFLSMIICLASVGIPFLPVFVAEFLSFTGAFMAHFNDNVINYAPVLTIIALSSLIISSVYILKIFHGIFYGKLPDKFNYLTDIQGHRLNILIIIVIILGITGIFPTIMTDWYSSYTLCLMDLLGEF